jgi:hypothetical protein
MKYFTPERYLRLDSVEEREAFLAALQEWEEALARYGEQLQRIKKELPSTSRSLRAFILSIQSVYLHDARVLAMSGSGEDFIITLEPPSDPVRLAILSYKLVAKPIIKQNVLPPERCQEPILWLYDELDLDRSERPRGRTRSRSGARGWTRSRAGARAGTGAGDELDLDQPESSRGLPAAAGKPTIQHNILLSNGWEVILRFRSARAQRPLRVIPVVPDTCEHQPAESRSA